MTKFIFVTGGVVSGLGKGITAASLGRLLKARGLKAPISTERYLLPRTELRQTLTLDIMSVLSTRILTNSQILRQERYTGTYLTRKEEENTSARPFR